MDHLALINERIREIGSAWTGSTADIFLKLYEPVHEKLNYATRNTVVCKDIPYGTHMRHSLDVYVPPGNSSSRAVAVYLHGGGFFSGDKAWSESLVYANIGYYLASHGIIAVLPNYRLVPDVQYPGGGDDVQLVREWVHANIAQTEYGHGDAGKVVFIGQSSGASHIATNLYAAGDSTKPVRDPLHPPLAGVVYLSAPFFFDASKARRAQTLCEYYGSDDPAVVLPLSPAGLLSSLPADSPVLNPRVLPTLMLVAQYDPKEIVDSNMLFFNTYRERSRPVGMLPLFRVLPGHNHITNVLSVGTADDAQGRILTEFIEECVRV